MIVICGNSVAEVEKDLEMMKLAIASGKPIGIGGVTTSEVEKALATLKQYMGGAVAPTTNPCGGTCGCQCNGCMTDEDDYPYGECPNCGEPLDEDGYCDSCGYGCEESVVGYRWYVYLPNGQAHEPIEKTYATAYHAYEDAKTYGYSAKHIGVDRVKDDDGSIKVLEQIQKPRVCIKMDEDEPTTEELPSIMEMLNAMASGDMNRITAMAKRMGME